MIHRLASLALIITLLCSIGGTSVLANTNNTVTPLPEPSTLSQVALRSQYHPRQGVDQTVNARVDRRSSPAYAGGTDFIAQVLPTSQRRWISH